MSEEASLLIRDEVRRLRAFGSPPADLLAQWEELRRLVLEEEKRELPQPLIADRYPLVREISRGGMGIHWRAWDTRLERYVHGTCKYLNSPPSDEANHRFVLDAWAQLGQETEHVVKILGYGIDKGWHYIIMESLIGEVLDARLERIGLLSVQELAPIVRQIANALQKAHQRGLVHRGIKPGNIFLSLPDDDEEERVKILDFSSVKAFGRASISTSGEVIGTVPYMAPEQIQGQPADPRTDLWALGVVLYRALTGRLPFDGHTPLEILSRVCFAPIPPPSTVVPDLSDDVDAFFARALARPPEERFQSAEELSRAFMKLASQRSPPPAVPEGELPMQ